MKYLVVLCCVLICAQAKRDWSKIISLDISPVPRSFIRSFPGTRVVGGEEAARNSILYQAGLFVELKEGTAFCGGSVISNTHILTAAHCVDKASSAEVVLGAHDILEEEATQVIQISTNLIVHERWIAILLQNDIALIGLSQPVEFNDVIQPISLPRASESGIDVTDVIAKVSGWGKDSDQASSISPVLRFVENNILSKEICSLAFFGITGDNHLCLAGSGGKGSCSGDSGGPLVRPREDGTPVHTGIVSFGLSLGCEIGWPSAFTRTDKYLDWISTKSGVVIEP